MFSTVITIILTQSGGVQPPSENFKHPFVVILRFEDV